MSGLSVLLIVLGLGAVALLLALLLVRFIVSSWIRRTIKDFEMEFPGRCGLCSYYRNVLYDTPPEHDCKERRL